MIWDMNDYLSKIDVYCVTSSRIKFENLFIYEKVDIIWQDCITIFSYTYIIEFLKYNFKKH